MSRLALHIAVSASLLFGLAPRASAEPVLAPVNAFKLPDALHVAEVLGDERVRLHLVEHADRITPRDAEALQQRASSWRRRWARRRCA